MGLCHYLSQQLMLYLDSSPHKHYSSDFGLATKLGTLKETAHLSRGRYVMDAERSSLDPKTTYMYLRLQYAWNNLTSEHRSWGVYRELEVLVMFWNLQQPLPLRSKLQTLTQPNPTKHLLCVASSYTARILPSFLS
ncbi:hypothetical protein VNO78_22152 [Psophocarpus tetragonolobus]|uniref:Uncharacterized protein n=1 Tax=Psophocarpus tetragonolobus TaxID=3891 RepID=A0AAN9XIQ7_PSOTE